jgi:hypothetical protein
VQALGAQAEDQPHGEGADQEEAGERGRRRAGP